LLKKSKKREQRERENSLFFVFLSKQDCFYFVRPRGKPKKIAWTREKIHSIQLNSLFNFHKIQSRCCYFSVKAKSEYAHHQTKSTQKEKEFI